MTTTETATADFAALLLATTGDLTATMEQSRSFHGALSRIRRHAWLDLTRSGVKYEQIMAACGVTRNQVTKAIRKAKDERGEP